MRNALLVCCLLVAAAWLPAQPPVGRIGNGRLTVAIGKDGTIHSLRWPGPDGPEQIPRDAPAPFHGGGWTLRIGTEIVSPDEAALFENNGVLAQERAARDGQVCIRYSWCVPPGLDAFCATVSVESGEIQPECFWAGALTPCTRRVYGGAALNRPFPALDGFAGRVTEDGQEIHLFRPDHPGASEWRLLESLPANDREIWKQFGEGVWCCLASPCHFDEALCLPARDANELYGAVVQGNLASAAASPVAGPAVLACKPVPARTGDSWEAAVVIGLGPNAEQSNAVTTEAIRRGADGLRAATQTYWNEWTSTIIPGTRPAAPEANVTSLLRALALVSGSGSGAAVSILHELGDMPYASGKVAAWCALAYDTGGKREEAERNLDAALARMRLSDAPGQPRGSLPAAYLPETGAAAVPDLLLRPEQTAWLLAGLWRHARFLDEPTRISFLKKRYEPIEAGAEFLVGWKLIGAPAPLPSFNAEQLRDGTTPAYVALLLAGLESATRIAECIQAAAPDSWRNRCNELEWMLRLQMQRNVAPAEEGLFWLRMSLPRTALFWNFHAENRGQPADIALQDWLDASGTLDFMDACAISRRIVAAFGMERLVE